jgi:hypothetical protein
MVSSYTHRPTFERIPARRSASARRRENRYSPIHPIFASRQARSLRSSVLMNLVPNYTHPRAFEPGRESVITKGYPWLRLSPSTRCPRSPRSVITAPDIQPSTLFPKPSLPFSTSPSALPYTPSAAPHPVSPAQHSRRIPEPSLAGLLYCRLLCG